MLGNMMLCGFFGVMRGVNMMPTSDVRMMCSLFMRAFFMVFGRFMIDPSIDGAALTIAPLCFLDPVLARDLRR